MSNVSRTKFDASLLRSWDPLKTVLALASYRSRIENHERDSMLIFGIRLAAGSCRGVDNPSRDDVHAVIQKIGRFYKGYSKGLRPLEESFAGTALFSNRAESNTDQVIEAVWKRFEKYDVALESRVGFNVANAIFFSSGITGIVQRKMEGIKLPKPTKLTKEQYYDFEYFVRPTEKVGRAWDNAITFSRKAILATFPPNIAAKAARYLDFSSAASASFPAIEDPLQTDYLLQRPILNFGETYVVPVPHYLLHGLSGRLHAALSGDSTYKGDYHGKKGGILEEWAAEELRLLFPNAGIFRNRKYQDIGGRTESDIIINYGEFLIFAECTTKWISPEAWSGDSLAIHDLLADSIHKCYK